MVHVWAMSANDQPVSASGPLAGIRIVEMPAIGPVPHAGLVLAELGADVTRITRTAPSDLGIAVDARFDSLARGKQEVALDLKHPAGLEAARTLIGSADALLEGFRPGVMERLGLGPHPCLAANPRLVYGRISGWGDAGPLAEEAGHDLNYLGLTGILHAIGMPGEPPPVPLNLIGDFGGAAMQLACGVLAALHAARATGRGRVVATSIYEGAAALTPHLHGLRAAGLWSDRRADNILDGAAPFYRTYTAADGRFVAVGAIEPRFYRALLAGLDLPLDPAAQMDRAAWPGTAQAFADRFATAPRDEWVARFAGTDACVSPVLDWAEAVRHPQAVALALYQEIGLPRTGARLSASPASK